jgi:hypothetical protein
VARSAAESPLNEYLSLDPNMAIEMVEPWLPLMVFPMNWTAYCHYQLTVNGICGISLVPGVDTVFV